MVFFYLYGTLLFQTMGTPSYPFLWRQEKIFRFAATLVQSTHTITNEMPPYPLLSGIIIAGVGNHKGLPLLLRRLFFSFRFTPCYRRMTVHLYMLHVVLHIIENTSMVLCHTYHKKNIGKHFPIWEKNTIFASNNTLIPSTHY